MTQGRQVWPTHYFTFSYEILPSQSGLKIDRNFKITITWVLAKFKKPFIRNYTIIKTEFIKKNSSKNIPRK
jgi:hypothetical protein